MSDIKDDVNITDMEILSITSKGMNFITGYEFGFNRGKAAMQPELDRKSEALQRLWKERDELLAKLKALEEATKIRDEADHNLHLFLSHFKYANDAMTVHQVLDNWKTDTQQIKNHGHVLREYSWPLYLSEGANP